MRRAILLWLLLPALARAERPTLCGAVGGGIDIEPSRHLATNPPSDQMVTLGSFSFEGEIQWSQLGLFARGTGTDGSIEFMKASFDRLGFDFGGTWRPLVQLAGGHRWRDVVAQRVTLEAGFTIQRAISRGDSGNNFGLHVGAHADLPLSVRRDGRGPFIRTTVQKTITLADDTLLMTNLPGETTVNVGGQRLDAIYVSAPAVQWLFALGVAF